MARTFRGSRREEWRRDRSLNRDRSDLHMARVERVALRRIRTGVIVLADVPYRESDGRRPGERKLRPALVVRQAGRNVTVLPITTKRGPRCLTRMPDGLLSRPSYLQARIVELDRIAIIEVIAELDDHQLPFFEPVLRTAAVTLGRRLGKEELSGTLRPSVAADSRRHAA